MKRKNDENCVVANMYAVFWFNKQNKLEIKVFWAPKLAEISESFFQVANSESIKRAFLVRYR